MNASLFTRLGGEAGITAIANDIVDLHVDNPVIATRFEHTNTDALKHAAATFFITGTGGPECYTGKDMLSAHKNMNISPEEFMAVLDDALQALDRNQVGQREKEEVLFILYGMKEHIVRT
ncbi:MAG: group 1 truncated hemoglobin [Gammaproteobacteria bacterium]|nr:MAG: group 1 truncated hemoglobin [Gammaproteobacteria bacterium]